MVLLSALAMPALVAGRSNVWTFYAFVGLVYWCYGTQLSVIATTMADFYGTKNLGLNYGVLFSAWGAAGILGPAIAGRVFVQTGDYRFAFYSAAVLALVAFAALSFARMPAGRAVISRQSAVVSPV
jgi:OFA family oxalate/formate antiporter-like MFS transporter